MDDEVVTVRFRITGEKIDNMTWEQFELLEEMRLGGQRLADTRRVLALFMIDEQGEPLPERVAYDALLKVRVGKIREITRQFWNALSEETVPKASDETSSPPSGTEDEPQPG